VELNRIEGLGEFVEIEALLPAGADAESLARARARVREVLAQLGIEASRIEPRPYMDLLRERGVGLE
jgi:predicted adenylyl cyclase CyaB